MLYVGQPIANGVARSFFFLAHRMQWHMLRVALGFMHTTFELQSVDITYF